jgi:subtilisin family serine protease
LPVVKIAAPGVDIPLTLNESNYGIESATSVAAPRVVGAASYYKLENPEAIPQQVMSMIINSSSTPVTVCDGGAQGTSQGSLIS